MAIERLAPDALLLQSNLTGAISALTDDPDSPDATFLTAPALSSGATKTYYFLDTQAAGAGYLLQDAGAAPTANYFHNAGSASGWRPGTTAVPRWWQLDYNTESTANLTSEPTGVPITTANAGNFFRAPAPLTGSFAAGNWTFAMGLRSHTAAFTGDYALKWRVFRTTDANGVSPAPTQITTAVIASATQTASLSTASATTVSATWSAPAFSLTNEYLFVTLHLHTTVAGTGNTQDVNLAKSSASAITTTAFTAPEPDTRIRVSFPTPQENPTTGAGLQEFRALARRKGAGSPTATLALYEDGVAVSTLAGPTAITSGTGQIISGTFNASGSSPSLIEADVLGTGVVGGSVEVGAIEWNADTTPAVIGAAVLSSPRTLYGATISEQITNTDVRVSFPTPTETLLIGPTAQEFRVGVRKKGTGADPLATIELWENGVFRSTLLGPTAVSSSTVLSARWNAVSLTGGLAGSNVECKVVGTGVSGGTLEVGAIEWNALAFTPQISAGFLERTPTVNTHLLYGDPIDVNHTTPLASPRSITGAVVQSGVIAATFIGGPLAPGNHAPGSYPPQVARSILFGATIESVQMDNRMDVLPSSIVSLSGLTGVVEDIQDDPANPDASFLVVG